MKTNISIIIPLYNSEIFLLKLFESIIQQTIESEKFEILFVDNNSNDNSKVLINKFKSENDLNIHYLFYDKIQSSYAARNYGISKAKGDYLAFTDADCILCEKWLYEIISFYKEPENKNIIVSGSVNLFLNNKRNIWENYDKEVNMRNDIKIHSNSAATANLIVPKDVFNLVGAFKNLTSGGDIEWTKNASSQGFTIRYVSYIEVKHPCRDNWNDTKKKIIRLGIGHGEKIVYLKKNYLISIIIYILKIFNFKTNIRISKEILNNIGIINVLKFNFYFEILRIYQLIGVVQGIRKRRIKL